MKRTPFSRTLHIAALAGLVSAGSVLVIAQPETLEPPKTEPTTQPTTPITPDAPAQPSAPRRVPNKPKPAAPAPTQPTPAPAKGTAPTKAAPTDPTKPAPKSDAKKGFAPPAKLGTIITLKQPREYYLNVTINVTAEKPKKLIKTPDGKVGEVREMMPFEFEGMSVIFPYVLSTSGSQLLGVTAPWPENAQGEVGFKGQLLMNDQVVDTEPDLLFGYPAGVRLAKWTCVPSAEHPDIFEVGLHVKMPVRCSATVFDEKAGLSVPWPDLWPQEAATALEPQLFVEKGIDKDGNIKDYDGTKIANRLAQYLEEEKLDTPRSAPPGKIAKLIAGKVMRDIQITGTGVKINQRSRGIESLIVAAPSATLDSKRGTEHDVTALLAALYREAGLPVRTVIAVASDAEEAGKFTGRSAQKNVLTSYCEFALYDQEAKTMNWVPVDIARMRGKYGKAPKLDQPWKYFGSHDDLDTLIPFALQFHPPTDVACYEFPLFWGWFVTPSTPPVAKHSLLFNVDSVPRRDNEGLQPAKPTDGPKAESGGSIRRQAPKPEADDKGRSNK